MRDRKLCWLILSVLVAALMFPPIINFILTLYSPPNIIVIGNPETWLSFFGNYFGGVISTIGAFVILMYTIRNSRQEQKLEHFHREALDKIQDIANRSQQFKTSDFICISTYEDIRQHQHEELSRLQASYDKYSGLFYSAKILYSDEPEANQFLSAYTNLMLKCLDCLKAQINVLSSYNNSDIACRLHTMDYAEKITNFSTENQIVMQLAEDYLKKLQKTYVQQSNQI